MKWFTNINFFSMNYKKGIGFLGVVITLILVGFVGFLVYSDNKSTEEVVIIDNFPLENDESVSKNQQMPFLNNSEEVEISQQTINVVSNLDTANNITVNTSTEVDVEQVQEEGYVCPFDDTPFFFITSPNGGEEYQSGQNIIVTWESCNIPPTAIFSKLNFVHENDQTKNRTIWLAGGEAGWGGMPSPLNDEMEIVPLSNTETGIIVESGTYKICMNGVWLGNTPPGQGISVSDCSDAPFVVN